jgi:hypothetical protein
MADSVSPVAFLLLLGGISVRRGQREIAKGGLNCVANLHEQNA